MRTLFSPPLMELVPSPYPWFCSKPATSLPRFLKVFGAAPQVGHSQSSGRALNWTPAETGYSGSPFLGS